MMMSDDLGRTSSALLRRLGDWGDNLAWGEFVARYSPLVRSCCRRFGLDDDTTEDLCQQVWVDLTRRIVTFRYDPGGSFRGWLRRFCRSRAVDLLRRQKLDGHLPFDPLTEAQAVAATGPGESEVGGDELARRIRLLSLAAEVQQKVQAQVGPDTWRAFWLIAVEDRSIKEAAEILGKSYAATFVAQKRVKQRLRVEGLTALRESVVPRSDPGTSVASTSAS